MSKTVIADITGYRVSAALHAAVETGIVGEIPSLGKMSIETLCRNLSLASDPTIRLLKFLSDCGYITLENQHVEWTKKGKELKSSDICQRWILTELSRPYWESWSYLAEAVRTECVPFQRRWRTPFFEFLSNAKELRERFHALMADFTREVVDELLEQIPFNVIASFCDVGGGSGVLVDRGHKRYPNVMFTVFDEFRTGLPGSRSDRIVYLSGDFFREVPDGHDVYVLKNILHDWNDSKAISILRNIRAAMGSSSRLYVVEIVLEDGLPSGYGLDLVMMVLLQGKERTIDQFLELAAAAELRVSRISRLDGALSVLELVRD